MSSTLHSSNLGLLTISQLASLAQITPRALRHYEKLGLLVSKRGRNQYRYYPETQLQRVFRIRELQEMGFSLKEIRSLLNRAPGRELREGLRSKLPQADEQIARLAAQKSRLRRALSVDRPPRTERKLRMSKSEAKGSSTQFEDPFLPAELLSAVQECVAFAKKRGLRLGPGRGSAPSSQALFKLGFTQVNPGPWSLVPERLAASKFDLHIDVQFSRGQEFVDFCEERSRDLPLGRITAFKMPLLDIIEEVHRELGSAPQYDAIDTDSDRVLKLFRAGDLEKIFLFDNSDRSLISRLEAPLPGYGGAQGSEKLAQYLKSQEIRDFRDVANIASLWRVESPEMIYRLERYRQAKKRSPKSAMNLSFLKPELQEMLEPNYGLVLYHEDLIRIIASYSGWDLARSNQQRIELRQPKARTQESLRELSKRLPPEVLELVLEEAPWAFCRSHIAAFTRLTRQTAILKTLHRDLYFGAARDWEQKHGFAWDEIGVRLPGVSLLQTA